MNLLFDTNILLALVRCKDSEGLINFLNPDNRFVYLSVASEAEVKSIAKRNKWGTARIEKLDILLDGLTIIEINHMHINSYVEIDSYSQLSNPDFSHYSFSTPRNMGKNDLWIASLAGLMGLQLVTTDTDFDHLNGEFFEVRKILSSDLIRYF